MAAFTSSLYHDVSLHYGAPPRDSLSTSLPTFLMQLPILFHVVLGSSWAFQSASCTNRSTKTPLLPSFNRHHLILRSNLRLIFLNLLIRISKIKSLCWVTTLSSGTILQSIQQPLSTFLVKKKSICLALDPLLKVIK